MQCAGVNMHLGRDARTAQGQVHDDAVLGRADRIGTAVRQKNGRRVGGDADVGRQLVFGLRPQVARIDRDGEIGTATHLVDVVDPQGKWLGAGFYSPDSALAVRILSREQGRNIDEGFFRERFEQAARMRSHFLGLPSADTTGYRLVHAEGDGLPGLIVDIYGQAATLQLLTIGMKRRQAEILRALREVAGVTTIVALSTQSYSFFTSVLGFEEAEKSVLPEARLKLYEESGRNPKVLVKSI